MTTNLGKVPGVKVQVWRPKDLLDAIEYLR